MSLADRLLDIRPLRDNPRFRRLWLGTTASLLGQQFAVVAILYQVWELTGSPVWVGAVGVAQAVPMVAGSLLGGTLADAFDRRRLVLGATLGAMVVAGLLAGQASASLDSIAVVLALVAAQAACSAIGAPARRTFVPRLLPSEQVAAGIALNSVSFQASMLVGPALGGVLIAEVGVTACYLVTAIGAAASFYGVLGLPSMRPMGESGRPGVAAIVDGWRCIRRRAVLSGAFLTDLAATLLAMPIALFPMVNDERFGGDPRTLGLLLSAVAVGGVAAGVASGSATRFPRPGRLMIAAAIVWGVALAGFGLASSLWLALGLLAVAGAADTIAVIARGTIVMLATPDSHRGRVGAVDHVIGAAGPHLGNARAGLVAGLTSSSFALVTGGLLCVAGVIAIAMRSPALRSFAALDGSVR